MVDESVEVGAAAMLTFPPRKSFVAIVTDFVKTFSAEHTDDQEAIARVQLATHELAENVVKYSAGELCVVKVSFAARARHPAKHGRLLITTVNDVTPGSLSKVCSYLEQLEEAKSPDQFYDEQIAESAKRANGSGLGLARIRAEASMEITHSSVNGQLYVCAGTNLPLHRGDPA